MKYAFAALLALLSTQAVVPSVRVAAAIEMVCGANLGHRAEEQTPREARRIRVDVQIRQNATAYVSRTGPEPDTAALFQRPPPLPLCSRNQTQRERRGPVSLENIRVQTYCVFLDSETASPSINCGRLPGGAKNCPG